MDNFVAPADKTHAVSGCICDLAVAYIHRALTCIQPISTDIVDQRIAQYKFLEINRRRVATYTKISTMDLAMVQDIGTAFCSEDHPAPLSGNAVVGLIAEHIAQSVATEFYGLRGLVLEVHRPKTEPSTPLHNEGRLASCCCCD